MFTVFADGSANLPTKMLDGIHLLPCSYTMEAVPYIYDGDIDRFDGHSFYDGLKEGKKIQTSLLNSHLFMSEFEPILKMGNDILYISMSSGISGTFNAARLSAEELMKAYPERKVEVIDSLGCGFGSGLLAVKAVELSKAGMNILDAAETLRQESLHTCQYFTVDNLQFLRNTGRFSGVTAKIATVLNIKPILFGDKTGHIVRYSQTRGRTGAIEMLAQVYAKKVLNASSQIICISHGDCLEDAERLAARITELAKPLNIEICMHEPFSGSHVGPGMLGVFFHGSER